MENKKYKLTDEKIEVYGRTLYRIEALMSFGDVKRRSVGLWKFQHNRFM